MRWPWAGTSPDPTRDDTRSPKASAAVAARATGSVTDWRTYLDPAVLVAAAVLTGGALAARRLYVRYLRRIPGAGNITSDVWRRRSLFGTVTSVGDGDGFRLFHTPGGRLAGWGWLPGRRVPTGRALLKENTISVRIAGVDAPEGAHFGKPAQPGAREALDWLRAYIGGRRVRAHVYRRDQYDRAVASVHVRRGLLRRDVGLQMLRQGLATVYEAKTGAEFGHLEARYRAAERWARLKRKGIWRSRRDFESPREYKTRTAGEGHGEQR